ncbi:MAG: PF20097 family protein [Candidatus Odinarchaeia archaeon]
MESKPMIYQVDAFNICPNCGETIYRGRLNSQWGLVFYYRTTHKTEVDKYGRPVIFEEIVRLGTPLVARFNIASICRSCLLLFFKATNFDPLLRGFDDRFGIKKKVLQKKVKEESKKPFNFKTCPICGNQLDEGYLCDNPPSGLMPGLVFHMKLPKPIGKRKEELIIVAEDFQGNFFEAYFCHNCFTAIGRIEKFHPFLIDYWDRFERPSKKVVFALDERNKGLSIESVMEENEGNSEESVLDDSEIDEIFSEDDLDIELELSGDLEEDLDDLIDDSGNNEMIEEEARLPYEYFPAVTGFLDPPKKYMYCPNCGVENSEDHEKCRNCNWELNWTK